jgi:hypothetical protein
MYPPSFFDAKASIHDKWTGFDPLKKKSPGL